VTANFNTPSLASFPTANTPVRLFDLVFTVQPTAPFGTYAINGVSAAFDPTNGTAVIVNSAPYTFQIENGSITAVPEPSSIAFGGILGGAFLFHQW
jgi:hypothetical protein